MIDPNSLSEKVQEEIKSNHNSLVVLEADQNISHGKVVRVMDLIKKGGAERIAIATKPRKNESRDIIIHKVFNKNNGRI